jgi:hypothetical protein
VVSVVESGVEDSLVVHGSHVDENVILQIDQIVAVLVSRSPGLQ